MESSVVDRPTTNIILDRKRLECRNTLAYTEAPSLSTISISTLTFNYRLVRKMLAHRNTLTYTEASSLVVAIDLPTILD